MVVGAILDALGKGLSHFYLYFLRRDARGDLKIFHRNFDT